MLCARLRHAIDTTIVIRFLEDSQVRCFEENKLEGVRWEAYGSFGPQDVHRQVAIVFKTPAFREQSITAPVQVYIQLKRPSDDDVSDPKPFQYVPLDPGTY